jgi:glycosyltransferase involved in cell wall biosynthesis
MTVRILQNIHLYPDHIRIIDSVAGLQASHSERVRAMVEFGLNGPHMLEPVVVGSEDAFLTSTADPSMQRAWAVENGLRPDVHPHEVLLAQIEHFKPDVLYTHGTGYFPDHVRRALKGLVKVAICWKAPPDFSNSMEGFDLAVNNFPSSFPRYEAMGIKTGWFSPSFDPAMEPECDATDRPVDIVFVGGYSRHHRNRARMLEQIAKLSNRYNVKLALSFDRATRLANTPLGLLPALSNYRAPKIIRQVAIPPLFGREMYRLFSSAKILVNTAIDVAGQDRGNIRCFEALGCGTLMLSDVGIYPPGMVDGKTMLTYDHIDTIPEIVAQLLNDESRRMRIAADGKSLLRGTYGKGESWDRFQKLVAQVA